MAVVKSPKNTKRKKLYVNIKKALVFKRTQSYKSSYLNYNFSWKHVNNKINKHPTKLSVSCTYIDMFTCY